MTTPPPNVDELVSAYLDGEAAPDEITLIESTPSMMERVEELRSVAERFATPTLPPAAVKEAQLGAALAAFDELNLGSTKAPVLQAVTDPVESSTPPPAAADNVRSFEAARDRRRPRRFNAIAAAAAMIAVVFLGITALSLNGTSGNEVADTAAMDTSEPDMARTNESRITASDEADDDEPVAQAEAEPEPEPAMQEAPMSAAGDADQGSSAEPAEEAEFADDEIEEAADEPTVLADVVSPEIEGSLYYLGAVASSTDLAKQIARQQPIEPEIFNFETCQPQVPELAASQASTLIALAFLDGQLVEVHRLPGTAIQLIIDRDTCVIGDELED